MAVGCRLLSLILLLCKSQHAPSPDSLQQHRQEHGRLCTAARRYVSLASQKLTKEQAGAGLKFRTRESLIPIALEASEALHCRRLPPEVANRKEERDANQVLNGTLASPGRLIEMLTDRFGTFEAIHQARPPCSGRRIVDGSIRSGSGSGVWR
jgi:hypothetical protein